ncbi:hypothetical protein BUALT_Bualt17G0042900 [Buddleja alternifolia]|uniref:ABC transporter domain-containing protein n=1 Tax=Buddleja alternifolia TaxID=168488 RepID=A0AAV6WDR7_9LAMI|nr:hypothetical protein BUALT_Bualt17G0042900 [Buddleja alternifolia]
MLWSFFPSNPFNGGLNKLNAASKGNGIGWRQLSVCDYGGPGDIFDDPGVCYPLSYFFKWLVGTILLWIILAIYLDNVIPNSAGSRKSYLYFLKPNYRTGRGNGKLEEEDIFGLGSIPHGDQNDETVVEEENSTKQQAKAGSIDPNVVVQFRGLRKKYEGRKCACKRCFFCCCCCVCTKMKPFTAGLWLNFPKDQLFCLLGPNGAGKTTSISCLIGITPVTGGDVLVYGNSIRSAAGMQKIRSMMGVCTQVKLSGSANLTARRYSGGMKRRLSVAIALIGDPKLVIMDEPTTGMDPVARRHVWNVIESAKIGRSIILTTHSMEEADILADRIGIMAKGKLRCAGNSTLLKSKFGTGFTAKVSFPKVDGANEQADVHLERRNAVKDYFKQHLSVMPEEENKYFLTFVIPREKENQLEICTLLLLSDLTVLISDPCCSSVDDDDYVTNNVGNKGDFHVSTDSCDDSNNGSESETSSSADPLLSIIGDTMAPSMGRNDPRVHNEEKQIRKSVRSSRPLPYLSDYDLSFNDFFSDLESRERQFGILNAEIGLATLEEVFLNIANKAELESRDTVETTTTVQSMQTVYLPSGIPVSAPTGARFVDVPGSKTRQNPRGLMVEIFWQYDPQGNLFVAGVSPEMLVPYDFPLPALPANNPGNGLDGLDQNGQSKGKGR